MCRPHVHISPSIIRKKKKVFLNEIYLIEDLVTQIVESSEGIKGMLKLPRGNCSKRLCMTFRTEKPEERVGLPEPRGLEDRSCRFRAWTYGQEYHGLDIQIYEEGHPPL